MEGFYLKDRKQFFYTNDSNALQKKNRLGKWAKTCKNEIKH